MNNRARYFLALICTLMIPATVFGGVPQIENCDIFTRATEDVSVFLCPACDGYPFSEAQTFGGLILMDATIEVYIRDGLGQPVPGVDRFTIWIDDPNLCWCVPEGNVADFDTDDPNGYTEFALPPCGGGCSENFELGGFLAGAPFIQNPIPFLKFNSADMNCDLVVNLIDLAQFTPAYFGPYSYCVDYHWDGVINLVDLAIFSQHFGHACPPTP